MRLQRLLALLDALSHTTKCEMMCISCNHVIFYQAHHTQPTVRVKKKNDANIQNTFPKCVCSTACAAKWKASSKNRRFLPKKRKASSKEHWVRTHIGFQNVVQLRLRIFRGCICVFRSCICVFQAALVTEKQNSNGKVSANVRHF